MSQVVVTAAATTVTIPATTMVVVAATPLMAAATAVPTVMCADVLGAPAGTIGWCRGSSSKGRFKNDLGLVGDHGLLESEHGACLAEGGKQGHVGDVGVHK
jgi:hypothetical protein